jgi:Ca-activated chloride channel family protein
MPFGEPRALLLLLFVPLLGALMGLVRIRRRRLLRRIGQADLVERLVETPGGGRWALRVGLVLTAATFLALALARPQWGDKLEEVHRNGLDVMIAMDVSASMLAEDVKPNRLARAREEVAALIDSLEGDRVGLVAFAGEAYVACPLTLDYSAAKIFLDVLDPSLIPVPGTAIAAAIRKSTAAFGGKDKRFKVLVLITDGEDHEGNVVAAAREAASQGVVLYTLGVGSGAGSPIPLREEDGSVKGYKKDREGKVVTSRLDPVTLAEIAEAAGGQYLPLTAEGREIRVIQDRIAGMEHRQIGARFIITHEERYQIPLVLALGALILEAGIGGRIFPRKQESSGTRRSREAVKA